MTDAFESRGRALEDQFFHQRDKKLMDQFKSKLETKEAREALAVASGINDEELLNTLVEMNIRAETIASLMLVPLIAVAWADGRLEPGERKAVLQAAHECGIDEGSAGFHLVEAWLDHKPENELLDVWKEYVHALKESVSVDAFAKLKEQVMTQAKKVADSAGGILGLINKTSPAEQKKIDELELAFA